MTRFGSTKRNIQMAILLGSLALSFNAVGDILFTEPWFRMGNLFLFLSAGALGLQGAVISCAFGIIPETLVTGDSFQFLHTLLISSAVAYCAAKDIRIPAFVVGTVVWALAIAPLLYLLWAAGVELHHAVTPAYLAVSGFGEATLLLISSCILINPTVWNLLTQRPRHVNFPIILTNVVPLICTILIMCALALTADSALFLSPQRFENNVLGFIGLWLTGMFIPALLGWRLTDLISKNVQDIARKGLLPRGPNSSFSGLSSEFWRKNSFQEVTSSYTGLRNTSEGEAPQAITSGLSEPKQGICALNRNGTVTFVNRRFRSYCGIMSNEVIGKRLDAIEMDREMCAHILKVVEETFSQGPRITELKINQLPQRLRYFEISSLMSDAFENSAVASGPDSIIIKVRDISEKRTIESHLLQSQKVSSLGTLASGLAHSFNDTLTAIAGRASMARHQGDLPAIYSSLDSIVDLTRSAGLQVREMLEFADGKPGLLKLTNFHEYIKGKEDLLRKMTGGKCDLSMKLTPPASGVKIDENLITQALTSVVQNATEAYSGETGKIEISLNVEEIDQDIALLHVGARPGKYVRAGIKDFGYGMTPEVLAHAFDPLFTTKSSLGHSGLGLSTAFAIVRAHDGFLMVESQAQKGTTVSIYLPYHELDASALSAPKETRLNGQPPHQGQASILIVEDNSEIRMLLSRMLSSLGYKVESCDDGVCALEKCKDKTVDLVIVDMLLPTMRGNDLAVKLRAQTPHPKILMISGASISDDAKSNADSVLQKPFDLNVLADVVHSTLKGPEDRSSAAA